MRGTTNPAPCCHLCNWLVNASPLLPPSEWQWLFDLWPVITNNLTFDPPTCLSELTQNWIRSSHGHSTTSLKISCKLVQPFSRNVADKETNKETKKEIEQKQNPVPHTGGGVIMRKYLHSCGQWCTQDLNLKIKTTEVDTMIKTMNNKSRPTTPSLNRLTGNNGVC